MSSLLILLLLISFTSWCQNKTDILPLRGINHKDTTTYAKVPISYIKKANIKLIERKYYIELNKQKDSIINYKNQYITSQQIIIKELSSDFYNIQKINNNIENDLKKQKSKNKVLSYTTAGLIGFVLLIPKTVLSSIIKEYVEIWLIPSFKILFKSSFNSSKV